MLEQLVVEVTETQAQHHPIVALVAEAFGPGEQDLADAVERVVLAARWARVNNRNVGRAPDPDGPLSYGPAPYFNASSR